MNLHNSASHSSHMLYESRYTHSMPCPCRAHAVTLPCRAAKGLECLSHLTYTVWPCLIHTCHDTPMTCSDYAVLLKDTQSTAVLCCGLEKNGIVGAWFGRGMTSVNQTRPHCVNQMGKTHSKPLAAWHGMGAAWARHARCELAFSGTWPNWVIVSSFR